MGVNRLTNNWPLEHQSVGAKISRSMREKFWKYNMHRPLEDHASVASAVFERPVATRSQKTPQTVRKACIERAESKGGEKQDAFHTCGVPLSEYMWDTL